MTVNPKSYEIIKKILTTLGVLIIYAIIGLIIIISARKGNHVPISPNLIAISMLGMFVASVGLVALLFGILWGIWRKDNAK